MKERTFKAGDTVMLNRSKNSYLPIRGGKSMRLRLNAGTVCTVVRDSDKHDRLIVRTHLGRWRRTEQMLLDFNLPDLEGLYIGHPEDFTLLQESPNKRLKLIDKR